MNFLSSQKQILPSNLQQSAPKLRINGQDNATLSLSQASFSGIREQIQNDIHDLLLL
jgi:hypothetical protein